MKKFLSLIIAAVMIFGTVATGISGIGELDFAITAQAADTITEGYYTFSIIDWEVIIVDVNTNILNEVVIPDTLGGYPVKIIGVDAFKDCTNITSVVIPDGIVEVRSSAFQNCYNLKKVTLSNNLTKISSYVFSGCSKLENIVIPDSVTAVSTSAFSNCTSLKKVVVGDGVLRIGEGAFYNCTSLEDLTVPASVALKSDYSDDYDVNSFKGCTNIKKLTISEGTGLMNKYFYYYESYDYNTYSPWINSTGTLEEVVIEEGVVNISENAFYKSGEGYISLKKMTFPSTLKIISKDALAGCKNLTDIYYNGTEKNWKNISVDNSTSTGTANKILNTATIHYLSEPVVNKYKVTWIVDGVSTVDEYEAGATISVPANPEKEGYVFKGWDKTVPATMPENDLVFTAVFEKIVEEDIYNIGEETYSFGNYGDSDSAGGHCFGMSVTSAGYYLNELDIADIGGSAEKDLYTLKASSTVRIPICKYQAIQGSFSLSATVAGGSYYKTRVNDIDSDWNQVVNYVKNHEYDNKGNLQIGYRRNNQGGHAINFLRYEEVGGQPRIYAYDNNFPTVETYFYKDSDGKIKQAPYSTFDGAIDCISLRSVTRYFDVIENYDLPRYIYADRDTIRVSGANVYPIDGGIEMGERVMFEIPAGVNQVTITPLVDNADFTYLEDEYSFGAVTDDTVGIFTLASGSDNGVDDFGLEIVNSSVKIKNPSTTTISYGDSIVLHADISGIPEGGYVVWTATNDNFDIASNGSKCTITPARKGDTTIVVLVCDANGNVVSSDEQDMTSKAGFFDKIIAFFKKLFGLTKVIPDAFRF